MINWARKPTEEKPGLYISPKLVNIHVPIYCGYWYAVTDNQILLQEVIEF